ncbi:hypothetical protein EW093_11135 [Thiospirochaeta perfilievii]|uniref:Uncharacterized protein n=1 Tax=Thiospirochaeta perfilievii TaxID=252967 RepID=A0A5C1QG95_9SPIO|nr:hypothetical protein [Thiospirochaeta perfilievii]QEN05242.1 hypothetical protein EW093_11135 [Thiospirochaeta perfilievii]
MQVNLNTCNSPGNNLIFSEEGEYLIAGIMEFLNYRKSPFLSMLKQRKSDLEALSVIVRRSPSLIKEMNMLGESRSRDTLSLKIKEKRIDQVVNMPTKVILGFGFSISLLHFWGFLVKLTFKFPELEAFKEPVEEAYSNILYSLMAEELYKSLLTMKNYNGNSSDYISSELIELWENRFENKTQFFAPYIRTLWEARQNIVPVLGTLMGSMELMRLSSLLSPIWSEFLQWYNRDFDDKGEALEEFLFDLKYEEITALRSYMKENHISAVDRVRGTEIISNLLNEPLIKLRERQDRYNQPQSLQLYQSFLRRRQDGINRQREGVEGPKQTLEELFLLFLMKKRV